MEIENKRNGRMIMTIKECYETVGASYDEVVARLGSETLVRRFALKFLKDTTYQELRKSIEDASGEEAFRAAHTLKGICLNLGFDALETASSALTEQLRASKETSGCEELMERVTVEYNKLVNALQMAE